MPKINQRILQELLVPIPPAAEQRRIVAKFEELTAICDGLESELTTSRIESSRLLEAVLHQALKD
jgi:type I restriction enzyme S subunit